MENLVITGLGAVTPIGIGVEEYWQGILDQKCGINRITRFQDENVPITIAGEVKGFDPKNYMPGKLAKETGTFIQYAYASAKEAIEQSGIEIEPEADRIGIVMATALSGTSIIADTERAYSCLLYTSLSSRRPGSCWCIRPVPGQLRSRQLCRPSGP